MNVSNIANNPLWFKFDNGKEYQVKRLSLLDLFGEFEVEIKKSYMDDIADMASRIKDQKERIEFQRTAIKDMPKGKELEDLVRSSMDTFDGGVKLLYLGLSKCNTVTLQEVKDIVSNPNNNTVVTNIMNYITGSDIEKEQKEVPKDATVIAAEKKI